MTVSRKSRRPAAHPRRRRYRPFDPVKLLLYLLLFILLAGAGVLIWLYYSKKILF